ncbi:MAG: hypothetical protein ACYDGM_11320 [Vulcanimicrobiaceae bacterium]
MESQETREQLEIVERILATSSRTLCAGGEFFLAWGLLSAAIDLLNQVVSDGVLPVASLWLLPALLVAGIVFSVWRSRQLRERKGRMSVLQRDYLNMLYLTLGITVVAQIAGYRFFAGWGQAAIWSVASSIVLFFIGMHGNRRAVLGGIVVIVALAIANLMPSAAGYIFAAGTLVGYAGFGLSEMLARE